MTFRKLNLKIALLWSLVKLSEYLVGDLGLGVKILILIFIVIVVVIVDNVIASVAIVPTINLKK